MLADWHSLGEVQYRKWQVYDMDWGEDFNLDNYLICGAPFGGPIALIKHNEDKANKLIVIPNANKEKEKEKEKEAAAASNIKNMLWIYTSAGKLLGEVEYSNAMSNHRMSGVIGMGWTDEEQFVMVFVDGKIQI